MAAKLAMAALTCLLTGGCFPQPIPATPENTEAGCRIQADDFKKTKMYFGPNLQIGGECFYYVGTSSPSSQVFALHFSWWFNDWRFLNSCYAKGGTQLDTRVSDHKVDSVGRSVYVNEQLTVVVSRSMCEQAAARPEGLELKFFGKRGDYQVIVPAAYFQGWFNWLKKQEPGATADK